MNRREVEESKEFVVLVVVVHQERKWVTPCGTLSLGK